MSTNYGNIPANFLKAGTTAIFTPDGETGGIKLPSVQMAKLNFGLEETETLYADKEILVIGDMAPTVAKPVYELTINQMIKPIIPFFIFGTRLADLVQSSGSVVDQAINGVYQNRAYFVGARMITAVTVKVGSTVQVLGVDYDLDAEIGAVTPREGGGIPDTTTGTPSNITVSFTKPALTLTNYTPFTKLSARGRMQLFHRDSIAANPREQYAFDTNLIPTDAGDRDPKKYSDFKCKVPVLGNCVYNGRLL